MRELKKERASLFSHPDILISTNYTLDHAKVPDASTWSRGVRSGKCMDSSGVGEKGGRWGGGGEGEKRKMTLESAESISRSRGGSEPRDSTSTPDLSSRCELLYVRE